MDATRPILVVVVQVDVLWVILDKPLQQRSHLPFISKINGVSP